MSSKVDITKPNIIFIIVDAVSYKYSWLSSKDFMPLLYSRKREFLNFHNHYAVAANTKANFATMLSGVYPSLHKVVSKEHSFRNNKYGYIHELAQKFRYKSYYYTTTPLWHADKIDDNLGFNEITWLSPSMGDYYIPGLNYNELIKLKIEEVKKDSYFLLLHYADAHQPFESPEKYLNRKDTINISKYKYRSFLDLVKQAKNYIRFKIDDQKIYRKYPLLKNNIYRPFIRVERYKGFYDDILNVTDLYNEYILLMKECSLYLDKALNSFLDYIKKENSENTIVVLLADHGTQIDADKYENETYLYEDMIHVPLSIITYDEKLNKRYNLQEDKNNLTSHIDIYETLQSLISGKDYIENCFFQNLLTHNTGNHRMILAEYFSKKLKYNEIKFFDNNTNISFKKLSSDVIDEILVEDTIISNYNANNYETYKNFKTKYNKYMHRNMYQR